MSPFLKAERGAEVKEMYELPAAAWRSYLGTQQQQMKLLEGEGWLRPRKKRFSPFLRNFHFQPADFGCLIPNLWGSPAGTRHPGRRNYPCRDETVPVYFSSFNYCEGRTKWQRSRAVLDPCWAGHGTVPVASLPPFSLLCSLPQLLLGLLGSRQWPVLCGYLSTEALNAFWEGADRGCGDSALGWWPWEPKLK